jgi:hypothetical protein
MSDVTKPRSPEEQWRDIERMSLGAEARELEEMSEEEIDRELRAAGMDPERMERDGNALAERLMREAGVPEAVSAIEPRDGVSRVAQARPAVIELSERRRVRWPLLLVAAVIASVAAATAVTIARRDDVLPPVPKDVPQETPAPPVPSPLELAATYRQDAQDAFARGDWQACLASLDRAKAIDPAGDAFEGVQRLREAARVKEEEMKREDKKGKGKRGTGG